MSLSAVCRQLFIALLLLLATFAPAQARSATSGDSHSLWRPSILEAAVFSPSTLSVLDLAVLLPDAEFSAARHLQTINAYALAASLATAPTTRLIQTHAFVRTRLLTSSLVARPRLGPAMILIAAQLNAIEIEGESGKLSLESLQGTKGRPSPLSSIIPEPEAYIDQLIPGLDDASADSFVYEAVGEDEEPVGRTSLAVKYNILSTDESSIGKLTEQGTEIRWTKETLEYGKLSIEAVATHSDKVSTGSSNLNERFVLRQNDFVINEQWQSDIGLGDLRASTQKLVNGGFRFHLPSSTVRGAEAQLSSDTTQVRVTAGQVGNLQGFRTSTFQSDAGTLAGISASHILNKNWSFAAQGWWLDGHEDVPDHESISGAVQYFDNESRTKYQAHTLVDSQGDTGVWLDGDNRWGRWRHRYGAFRFEPELLWNDNQVVNDRQGIYWRADKSTYRRNWSAGIDLEETNIDSDPALAGIVMARSFLNMSWRIRHNTRLGSVLSVDIQEPGNGLDTASSRTWEADTFLHQKFPIGFSRFSVVYSDTSSVVSPANRLGAAWDHDWPVLAGSLLRTTLNFDRVTTEGETVYRPSVGLSMRRDLNENLDFTGSVFFGRGRGSVITRDDNSNVTFALNWRPVRYWQFAVDGSWNRTDSDNPSRGVLSAIDRRVFLTVGYSRTRGSEPKIYGQGSGSSGTGRLAGRVFLDENRDGVWSPGEETPAGITVILDGRYERRTDQQGLYEFWPVYSGEHRVSIAVEDAPLPWGLLDESDIAVTIKTRQRSETDFPLVRLDE